MNLVKTTALAACAVTMLTACDSLSEQEARMVGDYYISEVSDNIPKYELRDDRSAVVRDISNGRVISADARWRVDNDSLIFEIDPSTVTVEGVDPSAVKVNIAERRSLAIISFNDITLSLRHSDGLQYDYHRRYHSPENDAE